MHYETNNVTATYVLEVAATYDGTTGDVCANGIHDGLAHAACGLYSLENSNYYGFSKSAHIVSILYVALSLHTASPLPYNGSVVTGYSHLTYPRNSIAFANVNCPSGLNSCTGNPVTNCNNDGGLLTIQCILRELF